MSCEPACHRLCGTAAIFKRRPEPPETNESAPPQGMDLYCPTCEVFTDDLDRPGPYVGML